MTQPAAVLLRSALALSTDERAWLAERLLASVETVEAPNDAPGEVAAAWATEIERRAQRALAGEPGIPWEDVRAEAMRIVQGQK
jgi:putative addiction module component (TIGR02574 family)